MQTADREPTLADVAALADVSVTTVSRVLNNRGYLSEQTKERVARAIDELGYRPNQVARALHGMATRSVGVIVPTVALPFFGELVAEIDAALAARGYRMLLCNSLGRTDRERDYLNLLLGQRVDGIISGAHNEDISDYETIRRPIVTIDRDLSPRIPNIRCDNEEGGRLATQALVDNGSRFPVFLTSRAGRHNLREAGYRSVVAAHGIEPTILTVDFHTPDTERQKLVDAQLDSVAGRIDGVFATDDLTAANVLEWARSRELRVPEDLKVVGFDGTAAIRRALPGLATIHQPIAQIAQGAVAVLLEQIEKDAHKEPLTSEAPDSDYPVYLIEGRTLS